MKEWADKHDMLLRMAQAVRDADATVPRSHGTAYMEAARIYAALHAADTYFQEQQAAAEKPTEVAETPETGQDEPSQEPVTDTDELPPAEPLPEVHDEPVPAG